MAVRALRTQSSNRRNPKNRSDRRILSAANDNTVKNTSAANDNRKDAQREYRKIRAGQRRREENSEQPDSSGGKIARARRILSRKKGFKKFLAGDSTEVKRIIAFNAAMPILGFLPALISFQFIFWVLQLAGFFLGSIPFIGFLLPAEAIIITGYILITVTNLILATCAVMLFLTRGVDCLGGKKVLVFMVCVAASMLPLVNIFPWILIWLFFVIYQQKESTQTEEAAEPEDT